MRAAASPDASSSKPMSAQPPVWLRLKAHSALVDERRLAEGTVGEAQGGRRCSGVGGEHLAQRATGRGRSACGRSRRRSGRPVRSHRPTGKPARRSSQGWSRSTSQSWQPGRWERGFICIMEGAWRGAAEVGAHVRRPMAAATMREKNPRGAGGAVLGAAPEAGGAEASWARLSNT